MIKFGERKKTYFFARYSIKPTFCTISQPIPPGGEISVKEFRSQYTYKYKINSITNTENRSSKSYILNSHSRKFCEKFLKEVPLLKDTMINFCIDTAPIIVISTFVGAASDI